MGQLLDEESQNGTDKGIIMAAVRLLRRQRCREPGMGTIHGRLQSIHASEICAGVA